MRALRPLPNNRDQHACLGHLVLDLDREVGVGGVDAIALEEESSQIPDQAFFGFADNKCQFRKQQFVESLRNG